MPPKAKEGAESPAGAAQTFTVGQRVLVQGRKGEVKFYGDTKFAAGIWVGIALEDPIGKNDGVVQDVRYFTCDANKGIFVRPNNVLPDLSAGAPPEAPAKAAAAEPKASPKIVKRSGTVEKVGADKPKVASSKSMKASSDGKSGKAEGPPKKAEPGSPKKRSSNEVGGSPKVGAAAAPKGPPAKAAEAAAASPPAKAPEAAPAKAAAAASPKAAAAASPPAKLPEAAAKAPAHAAAPAAGESSPKASAKTAAKPAAAKPPAKATAPAAEAADGGIGKALPKAADGQDPEEAARLRAAQEEKSKAQQQIKELTTEVARLEKALMEETMKLTELTTKADAVQRETDQLERIRAQAMAKRSAGSTKLAEVTKKAEEAEKEEGALLQEEAELAKEKARLQQEKEELEKKEAAELGAARADQSNPEHEKRLRIQRLRQEIAVERAQHQLLELEREELQLEVEDAKLQVAELAELPPINEQQQVLWHKKALWSFFEDHTLQMRKLRQRQARLERAAKHSRETKDGQQHKHDVEELQRSVEQLTQRLEYLNHENEIMETALEERLGLRQEDLDMLEAQRELEEALMEELAFKRSRASQLEALAQQLYQGRQELLGRLASKKGMVARLEVRLQTLTAQAAAQAKHSEGEKAHQAPEDEGQAELTTAARAAEVRGECLRAQAWAACIPSAMRDEAELGHSFHTLCALHRCLDKAQIFSSFVQETFIEDSVLSVLQLGVPMSALCSATLATSQLAYAAAGVLGRLHAVDQARFSELARKPAVTACGDGEQALDAATGAVLRMLQQSVAGDDTSRSHGRGLPEALAALNALVAQLFSVQTSLFKDESFASWQGACYVSQAVRAACASALYASEDAGGSRRKKWQHVYSKAHRICRRLAPHLASKWTAEERAAVAAGKGLGLLVVEASEPLPAPRASAAALEAGAEGAEGAEAAAAPAEAAADASAEVGPDDRDPNTLAEEGHLTQALLDGLSRQASVLNGFADAEPKDDRTQSKLDKAFATADKHFDALIALIKSKGGKPKDKVASQAAPQLQSWKKAREVVVHRVQAAEKDGPIAVAEAQKELDAIAKAFEAAEQELAKERAVVGELERKYSAGRIEAEQYNLAESQVTSLTNQMHAGKTRKKFLEEELKREAALAEEKDKAALELRQECKELNLQIVEAERRLRKRYNQQIPMEDVVALRRTCMRQQREILFLSRRSGHSCKELLADEESKMSAAAAARKRTMSAQSKTLDTVDDYDPQETMDKCWQGIQVTQKELLLEQARATLLNLEDADPQAVAEARNEQLRRLAEKSAGIRAEITTLLQKVANPHNTKKKGSSQFASVALTRFLKETAASVDRGPMAKIAVTAPTSLPAPLAKVTPSVPVLADVDQLMSIHHALL